MTQDERWGKGTLRRRLSSRQITAIPPVTTPKNVSSTANWLKQNKKLLNAGEMKENRVPLFEKLGGHFCNRPLCVWSGRLFGATPQCAWSGGAIKKECCCSSTPRIR